MINDQNRKSFISYYLDRCLSLEIFVFSASLLGFDGAIVSTLARKARIGSFNFRRLQKVLL
jgi:hypothetical protein